MIIPSALQHPLRTSTALSQGQGHGGEAQGLSSLVLLPRACPGLGSLRLWRWWGEKELKCPSGSFRLSAACCPSPHVHCQSGLAEAHPVFLSSTVGGAGCVQGPPAHFANPPVQQRVLQELRHSPEPPLTGFPLPPAHLGWREYSFWKKRERRKWGRTVWVLPSNRE